MKGHMAGKCEKVLTTGRMTLSGAYEAVEWCQTHQHTWDACEDKRANALLLEALKEARDGLAPFAAFADEIDDQSAVAYRTVLYDNCVKAREKLARIDSAIAAAIGDSK